MYHYRLVDVSVEKKRKTWRGKVSGGVTGLFFNFTDTTHQLTKSAVDKVNDTFEITGHGFSNGDQVRYNVESSGTTFDNLTNDIVYTVIYVSDDSFRLSTDGTAATKIDLTESIVNSIEKKTKRDKKRHLLNKKL